MASSQQQYEEQLALLHERFPNESKQRLLRHLQETNGDVDKVRAYCFQRQCRERKLETLEERFGSALDTLQQQFPSSQMLKRPRLLKLMERFNGETEYVRKYLDKCKLNEDYVENTDEARRAKYSAQLTELSATGVNVKCPCLLAKLDKHHGDVEKVMEDMTRHNEKKDKFSQLEVKYAGELAQLAADGVTMKNKRYLLQLLERADGQVEKAKELLAQRDKRKEQTNPSSNAIDDTAGASKTHRQIDADDLDNIKLLRAAGVHGNPVKILSVFHECHESIELTIARLAKEREEREQRAGKRFQQRVTLAGIHDAYLELDRREDWPADVEQVYLDGNNMMFVVDTLRRLCLNRAGRKTERAIAVIAAAWNEQMRLPNVELVFDATRQLDQVGSVRVSSAHPAYPTTDDMLIDIARREKNKRTVVVTSDRALATQLKQHGCQLVKSFAWFAHCAMVLTPDLVSDDPAPSAEAGAKSRKCRYNLDELVRRIGQIE